MVRSTLRLVRGARTALATACPLAFVLGATISLASPALGAHAVQNSTPPARPVPPAATPTPPPAAAPATPPASDKPATPPAAPQVDSALEFVKLATSKGDIILELDRAKAPLSVANFLAYVDKGFYEGTIFHRVIGNFMIQGGGFTTEMSQKDTAPPIKNEWQNGLKNKRGTIAMARTNVPDSATSQFFINVVDNDALDMPRGGAAYAVFGRVVAGLDVVDAIKAVPTAVKTATTPSGKTPFKDVPVEAITITKVTRLTPAEAKALIK